MAHQILDRVQQTTTSQGIGSLAFTGTVNKMLSFAGAGFSNGDTFWGLIEHETADEWELALCTYASAGDGSITRATPAASSTGAAVAFSAGTKYISLVAPAGKSAFAESIDTPAISGGVLTLDLSKATVFKVALNANVTSIAIVNPPAGKAVSFALKFTADGTARTVAQPASVVALNGTYTPSSVNGKRDRLAYFSDDGGTTWEMLIVGQNY